MNNERGEAAHAFLAHAGWKNARIDALPGDASTRRYYRVKQNGHGAMLMDQPQNSEAPASPPTATPEERQALGYNATARLAGADCERFIATANFLRSRGLAAPRIYADDTEQGFVLLEDFGDDLYADVLGKGVKEDDLYRAAIDAIAQLHADPAPPRLSTSAALYDYDLTACLAETDLMTEWFMPLALGRPATQDEVTEHRGLWRDALGTIRSPEPVFVHRDYHAQNLFWLPQREGAARVGMIDFQDALAGNRSYDVISLLEDARRDVSPELAAAMKAHYLTAMKEQGRALDGKSWTAEAAITAAQRNARLQEYFRVWQAVMASRGISRTCRACGAILKAISGIRRSQICKTGMILSFHAKHARGRDTKERSFEQSETRDDSGRGAWHAHASADQQCAEAIGQGARKGVDRSCDRPACVCGRRNDHRQCPSSCRASEVASCRAPRCGDLISDETDAILGSGGGIFKVLPMFEGECFFVHNANSIWVEGYGQALERMIGRWNSQEMDALLLAASLVTAIGYEGPGDFLMDAEGRLSRVPEGRLSPFAFPGVQILHPRFFDGAKPGAFSINPLWDGQSKMAASSASALTACGCMSAHPMRSYNRKSSWPSDAGIVSCARALYHSRGRSFGRNAGARIDKRTRCRE